MWTSLSQNRHGIDGKQNALMWSSYGSSTIKWRFTLKKHSDKTLRFLLVHQNAKQHSRRSLSRIFEKCGSSRSAKRLVLLKTCQVQASLRPPAGKSCEAPVTSMTFLRAPVIFSFRFVQMNWGQAMSSLWVQHGSDELAWFQGEFEHWWIWAQWKIVFCEPRYYNISSLDWGTNKKASSELPKVIKTSSETIEPIKNPTRFNGNELNKLNEGAKASPGCSNQVCCSIGLKGKASNSSEVLRTSRNPSAFGSLQKKQNLSCLVGFL